MTKVTFICYTHPERDTVTVLIDNEPFVEEDYMCQPFYLADFAKALGATVEWKEDSSEKEDE